MTARILVAYATKKGSTAEIAGAIGKELQSLGHEVTVKEMKEVMALEKYDGIVLGAPVYMGKMIGIGKFVKRFRERLAAKPVAVFAVGTAPVSHDQKQIDDETRLPSASVAPQQPASTALFAGVVDPEKFGFFMRKMVGAEKSMVGDFRDWEAIAAWARDLPGKMGL
ncbi:menaquinone-dependent protoporphyrinogen oxidase [Methanolinea mesophila]|uniref:flavodoxin domain-containing protein n=1 Tax=Methanolinea mesophila TaxID=547055 RepID=UPI001AEAE0A4|nr:flavodoxin domain-containing protein [Methanolinea mesophila]MBP1929969.1 menaquinone-dependent protoporphyrinogen oxidase [Methanolinea mesophila]